MKGIQDSKVYTPYYIIERMINLVTIQKNVSICDPACGTGNILVSIIHKMKFLGFSNQEIANSIFGYDINNESVQVCCQRISDLLPDISTDLITDHIKCCNTLLETLQQFDIIIMNPPFEKNLHKKFLVWAAGHSRVIVSIQPCQFLYKHYKLNKLDTKLQNLIQNHASSIYIMNPNLIWQSHKFASPVGIFNIDLDNQTSTIHIYDEMTDDYYKVASINEICKRHKQLAKFIEQLIAYLKLNPDTVIKHINMELYKPWIVELAKIRGHISEVNRDIYSNDDFATMVTRDHRPITKIVDFAKQHFCFNTKIEAENFIEYLKTDFARICLYINKFGLHIDSNTMMYVPWLDFTKRWTDDELFNIIGVSNPNLAGSTLVPKYYK